MAKWQRKLLTKPSKLRNCEGPFSSYIHFPFNQQIKDDWNFSPFPLYLNNIQNVPIFLSLLSILLILFSSCILISTFLSIVTKMRLCWTQNIVQIHTISENSHRTMSRSILRYMQIHVTKLLPMNFLTKTTTCYSIDAVEQTKTLAYE